MATTAPISTTQQTAGKSTSNPKSQLKVDDFINLMVTQLQNQDPTSPASNSELLQQMSQIGQLQSQEDLTSSLKSLVLQNNIGSASGMIGKTITGADAATGEEITGTVSGLTVAKGAVTLKLDTGATISMANVTAIENADVAGAADIAEAVAKSAGAKADAADATDEG